MELPSSCVVPGSASVHNCDKTECSSASLFFIFKLIFFAANDAVIQEVVRKAIFAASEKVKAREANERRTILNCFGYKENPIAID